MKQIVITISLLAGMAFGNSLLAQCPEIDCPGDVTLYAPVDGCSVTYNYSNPDVTDFCHAGVSFAYSGAPEMWIVPNDVHELMVRAWGASGGHGSGPVYGLNMGGKGAYAEGRLDVNPGDTLYIYVGGKGTDAQLEGIAEGGWNGGGLGGFDADYTGNGAGGGGGASDIRVDGNDLAHRVLVAAGGGGASKNAPGGAGGAALGLDGASVQNGAPGLAGRFDAGGIVFSTDRGASAGAFGQGGNGSSNQASWGGGGGGAGYYGGSGGTATQDHPDGQSGSGGGGSSFIGGLSDGSMLADQRIGHGMVTINYANPAGETAYLASGPASGSDFSVGTTSLTFAANGGFDTSYCSYDVIVLDTVQPVALVQDFTLQLDENDEGQLLPANIDAGSADNCSIVSYTLSQEDFNETHEGANTVTLTVEDASGNTSSASCTVTVNRQPQGLVAGKTPGVSGPPAARRNLEGVAETVPKLDMRIWPNPATFGKVTISVQLPEYWERARLNVYDATGKQVISQFVPMIMENDRMLLPIDALDKGTYLVQLTDANNAITERLVIQ